jgi:hypothetical protein
MYVATVEILNRLWCTLFFLTGLPVNPLAVPLQELVVVDCPRLRVVLASSLPMSQSLSLSSSPLRCLESEGLRVVATGCPLLSNVSLSGFVAWASCKPAAKYHLPDIAMLRCSVSSGCINAIGASLMASKRETSVSLGVGKGVIVIEWSGLRRFTATAPSSEVAAGLLMDAVRDAAVVCITCSTLNVLAPEVVARLMAWESSTDNHTLVIHDDLSCGMTTDA